MAQGRSLILTSAQFATCAAEKIIIINSYVIYIQIIDLLWYAETNGRLIDLLESLDEKIAELETTAHASRFFNRRRIQRKIERLTNWQVVISGLSDELVSAWTTIQQSMVSDMLEDSESDGELLAQRLIQRVGKIGKGNGT